jgi:serine/threonine-protein kinase HipA
VSLIPLDQAPEVSGYSYEAISDAKLIEILDQLPQRPLLAGRSEVRLSLAGAQNKIALRLEDTGYSIPKNESPSTHLLKPEVARFPGLAENEAYCLKLAAALGLKTCQAEAVQLGPYRCLLVNRYDRVARGDTVDRLHQEDFCQALGFPSRTKYQSEGGPGLAQCFELLRRVSSSPARDLLQLFNAVLFNFLIGNHDAHGKNFSLLYLPEDGRVAVRLAPFYDLVSTAIYPELTPKMAMKIGKSSLPDECRLRDWELYWEAIGFSQKQARRQTLEFLENLSDVCELTKSEVETKIQSVIRERVDALRGVIRG